MQDITGRELPEGTVTFLFTDIAGSTRLLKALGDKYVTLLADHRRLMREIFARWNGREVDTEGDAFFVSFPRASEAVSAAVEAQRSIAAHQWPGEVDVRVRMGLHTGEPWTGAEGYVGMDVHRAARIAHSGHGAQVLLSETTAALVRGALPDGVVLRDLGLHRLKDMQFPERIRQLVIDGLPSEFPPLKSLKVVGPLKDAGPESAKAPSFLSEQQTERPAPLFVGRERVLEQLNKQLELALQGQGRVVFVAGEAGSGKTSLLSEFARRAQESHPDLVVASGACNAYAGAGDAYLPFRDIVAMLTGDVEATWSAGLISREHALRLWRLLPATTSAIVQRAPELLGIFVSPDALVGRLASYSAGDSDRSYLLQERLANLALSGIQSQDQSQLFGAYTELLKILAKQHPLVLILDDLHWADVSSINLLFHLARRIGASRILILGAYRPEEIALSRANEEHPLNSVLGEFKRNFGDVWVDLDRGERAERRAFVDALLDSEPNRLEERFREELAHHTRGHPLFTVELLQDMQERGDLEQDEEGCWTVSPNLGWDSFPAKVEGVIEKRIGRLDDDLQEILAVASVEGETFTAEVVAQAMGVEEPVLVRYLSGKMDKQHGLVRATGIERLGPQRLSRYRFRHNLIHRYLYHSLDEVERAYWHEAVANVLEGIYAHRPEALERNAGQLAYHFHQAGDHERATRYYEQAGERAVRLYAYEEAQRFLQRALALCEEDNALSEKQLELLEALGDVGSLIRNQTQAVSYYQAALELWSNLAEPDEMNAVRLHRKILENLRPRFNYKDEALQAWIRTMETSRSFLEARLPLAQIKPPGLEWVRVLTSLAKITEMGFPVTGYLETAEGYAQAAVELAEQQDAPVELSDALDALGRVYYARGQLPEQLEISRRRLALSQDPRFSDLYNRAEILWGLSDALMVSGQYAQAMPHLVEIEMLGMQTRVIVREVWGMSLQALCLFRLDRWDEVLRLEEKLRELKRDYPGDQLGSGYCAILSISAATHALRGDLDRARFLREQAFAFMVPDADIPPESWGRTQYY